MPELNVYFWGIICHVDQGENNRPDFAAIVRDIGAHKPRIHFSPDRVDIYEIASDVTFLHGVAPPNLTQDYHDTVPKLRSIVGGQLAIDDGDAWRVEYAKGEGNPSELSAADLYGNLGIHRSKGSGQVKRPELPVARLVRLRVPLQREEVTVQFTGTNSAGQTVTGKTIASNSCILISNVEEAYLFHAGAQLHEAGRALKEIAPKTGEVAPALDGIAELIGQAGRNVVQAASAIAHLEPNHFEYYTKLVAGDDVAQAHCGRKITKPAASLACDWLVSYIREMEKRYRPKGAVRTECANTNWP